jgi:hypothetical protein
MASHDPARVTTGTSPLQVAPNLVAPLVSDFALRACRRLPAMSRTLEVLKPFPAISERAGS